MKKLERIINEVVSDITDSIIQSLCAKETKAEIERYYGEAYIIAEVGLERLNNGFYLPYKKAIVCHHEEHQSPRLEQAITDALPTWDDIEAQYNENIDSYDEHFD